MIIAASVMIALNIDEIVTMNVGLN